MNPFVDNGRSEPRMRRLRRRVAAGGVAALLVGCAGSQAAPTSTVPTSSGLVLSARVDIDQGGIDADALLGSSAEKVLEQGGTPLWIVATGAAAEGDRVGGFVRIRPDSCLVAYARGTDDIEDLDVLTFDDRGASLTADESIRPTPAVVICPPHPDRVYIAARVSSGHGLVALGVQGIDRQHAPGIAIKLRAHMSLSDGQQLAEESWPGLAKRIAQRREVLGGHWVELRRLSVPVSPRAASYVSAPLPASRCLDVLVMPNEETRGLRVSVADDEGTIIGRGADRGEDRVALVCSPVDTTLTISIRPRRGHGQAAVVLSRSEAGAEAELAVRPDARRVAPMQPLAKRVEQVARQVSALGYARASEVGHGRLEIGATFLHRTHMNPGCTRFDVLAGSPIVGVRASLWARDVLWADAEGGEQTTLFGCTDQPTDVEIEVDGQGPPGQHVVQARPEPRSIAPLRAHPIAAGRLLARVHAAAPGAPTAAIDEVHILEVREEKRGSHAFTIASGKCKRVVAALGAGAHGVEVQAVQLAGNRVMAAGHGGVVASTEVCAQDRPLRIELRLSVHVGKTSALLAILNR